MNYHANWLPGYKACSGILRSMRRWNILWLAHSGAIRNNLFYANKFQ